eukprot:CAMPEP_0113313106 /NCGR_PEP_ID=MMETSP0010_2-20120614/9660_1 /TAXON_ID=216773 ORGANISM="Corethron hystrix, Strain 308" /NCGR_SAMPLE_ID=MMETSP0010_2 /ASSEMBLY_ACC=CAM_ASM_000155 /LENGTH=268 /DNA_ID=CAMNT_0000169047 /DNA_START=218 /DNA_END=1021 /DNA_ORIENTATION=- /assembly_acc=CAM_ASM_000155
MEKSLLDTQLSDDYYQDRSLIINGTVVPSGRYPYMVEFYPEPGCGGSLIAPDVVLTSAHCLFRTKFSSISFPRKVTIGRHFLYSDIEDEEEYEVIETEAYRIHGEYIDSAKSSVRNFSRIPGYADIALIKLAKSSSITPVKMSTEISSNYLEIGDILTVMGYGITEFYNISSQLLETDMEYVSTSECESFTKNSLRRNIYAEEFFLRYEFCAFPFSLGVDCSGDSGGPVVLRGNTSDEDILVASVSWGLDCSSSVPSVYADIGAMGEW